jgi:hypothetical protein
VPWTEPSFLPSSASSSTPIQTPAANDVDPTNFIVPGVPWTLQRPLTATSDMLGLGNGCIGK